MNLDFINELRKRFTGELRLDSASRALYSTDASIYQIQPLGIAIPTSQEDLISAVELAVKYKIPIIPRGSGSSLGGQSIGEALILDCSRHLDSIIKINPETHSAIVEPGVILANLNRAASKHGLMYGPDPASAERATMGGVIGNNATGAHSILYGMSADHLLEADVILSDGSLQTWGNMDEIESRKWKNNNSTQGALIRETLDIREKYAELIKQHYPKSWRNSAGYRLNYLLPFSPSKPPQWQGDYPSSASSNFCLHSLLAGSEGTLAVIRRATVNLVQKPTHTILGVLSYQSIAEACDDVPRLLEYHPSAIELIPQLIIQLARSSPAFARQMGWMVGDPAAVLVIEFSGDQPQALKLALRRLGGILTIAESAEDQARIWNIRKMGLGILDSRPQSARPIAFIEDCAIPVESLGEFIREVEKIMEAHGTYGGVYAHASAGCLHIRPVLDLRRGEGVRAMRSIVEQVFILTATLGGSMSSEHGDGIISGEFIERTYGVEITSAMRRLKHAADPHNILNPHKMFDAPPMDTNLRYEKDYQTQAWIPALHFEHEHGLSGVIEHCNGQGVCRKTTGVMCPSFQATRDEAFSTRGRANLLRTFITTENKKREANIENATFNTLDLCLACKGCTAECPSGVDMPKLKYEFMNEYYKTHWRPLHDYLFGYFHIIAKLLNPIAPLINALMKINFSKKFISRAVGITEQRVFPAFTRKTAKLQKPSGTQKTKAVIFLSDVFSRYMEPEVEQAAFDILNALHYEVKVLPMIGSGAALLSKGFIDAARKHAEKVLAQIKLLDAGAGLSVVGCEPPEVYSLKHEYSALLPDLRAEIESITKNVWLLDEFLLRDKEITQLTQLDNQAQVMDEITFHPHCHQRAEGMANDGLPAGVFATSELLNIFGFKVNVMEAGCCGMAGTFGYDAEHYDLSMQIGELGVLPKARIANNIVSTGAACRIQIKHGANKDAIHPLVLISNKLEKKLIQHEAGI